MLSGRGTDREDGFTLIELLVSMAAGMVVIAALTTLLISTLNGTQQAYARIDATRGTRGALAEIENDLHSACVGTGTTQNLAPIQAGSDGDTVRFVSYTGTTVNPTPVWHEIDFTGTALTDTTYRVTGTYGSWTPGNEIAQRTLLSNVSAQAGIPFFQYFAYQASPGPDNEDYWTIPDGDDVLPNGVILPKHAETVPLTAGASGTAASTVEVLITLAGGPSADAGSTTTTPDGSDPEADAISLRLTTPPNEAAATAAASYGPCE